MLMGYLFMQLVTNCLKIISFHHVMHDVRGLVRRVIKKNENGEEIKVNEFEGTIYGINKEVYEMALTYPRCLSFCNYMRFMVAPTCCYQLIYPLEEHRSWRNICKRLFQVLGSALMMVYIFYQHIIPVCRSSVIHFENKDYFNIFISVLNVGIPCAYIWLVMFFLIFHSLMNLCAEITRFADKRFYSDWWNAGNLAEYWRKWNYPIHNWLVRHVYFPLVRRSIRPDIARLLTFTVSAIFHEYIVMGVFRVFNFMAFLIMIINVPVMQF